VLDGPVGTHGDRLPKVSVACLFRFWICYRTSDPVGVPKATLGRPSTLCRLLRVRKASFRIKTRMLFPVTSVTPSVRIEFSSSSSRMVRSLALTSGRPDNSDRVFGNVPAVLIEKSLRVRHAECPWLTRSLLNAGGPFLAPRTKQWRRARGTLYNLSGLPRLQ
jgi:hypothetical protein